MSGKTDFCTTFQAMTGNLPFPWQSRLYDQFVVGEFPNTASLPTGLGKTSIIAIWLIALANCAEKVPRRLVYVVNRRTVVDQTTDEVEKYRKHLSEKPELASLKAALEQLCAIPLKPTDSPLAISTLRGQFADNREWSTDPARPAVICGTVDMIGSRLLFSGYGCGFKTKPAHAGFLGQDALLVHDEAHLEPAFQELIEKIESEQVGGERSGDVPWKKLRVMELTATPRGQRTPFVLSDEERSPPESIPMNLFEPIHHVWARLCAKKALRFHAAKRDQVATEIARYARDQWGNEDQAVLLFVRTINDVEDVRSELTRKRKDGPHELREGVDASNVQVLTGTMRGFERDRLASEDAIFARFMPNAKVEPAQGTVYLICTSAGEVGVDISADHMVCDLSTLDSMAQRFGRVNRRGAGNSMIDVFFETDRNPKPPSPEFEAARWKTKEILERLPRCQREGVSDRYDASPRRLGELFQAATDTERERKAQERQAAFAPPPTILAATDILFDSWALTTIREKLPGRPPVEPYLHGLSSWEPPETQVAWRKEVEIITGDLLLEHKPKDLLEQFPVLPHEILKDRSQRVFDQFFKSKKLKLDAVREALPVWIVSPDGTVEHDWTVRKLIDADKAAIEGKLVLMPPSLGGLNSGGMLDPEAEPRESGDELTHEEDVSCAMGQRVRVFQVGREADSDFDEKTKGMHLIYEINSTPMDDEDSDESAGGRYWMWYKVAQEGERTTGEKKPVRWDVHVAGVVQMASQIVAKLPLTEELRSAINLAAWFHDHGKRRRVFQNVLSNTRYPEVTLAKSGGKRSLVQEKYRHEFGSLVDLLNPSKSDRSEFAAELAQFSALSQEMQDVVLHLIATHHGWGRPHFDPEEGGFDPERSGADEVAREVPRRFARLQRRYGRWGLAYLESLLRAADWAASSHPSEYWEDK